MVLLGIVMGIFGSRDVLMVSQSSYSPLGRLPPSPTGRYTPHSRTGRYPPSSTPTSTCFIITSPPKFHPLIHPHRIPRRCAIPILSAFGVGSSRLLGVARSQLTPRRNQRIRPPTFHRRSRIRPNPPQGSCRNSRSRMRRRRYWTSSPCFRLYETGI
jgi:hypothetical protein